MKIILYALVFAVSTLAVGPVTAQTTIVNTGPGSVTQGGTVINATQSVASRFYSDAATITGAQGWFSAQVAASPSQLVYIRLYSDGGQVPDSILYSTSFASTPATIGWNGVLDLNWTIDSGNYWLAFEGTTGGFGSTMPSPPASPLLDAAVRTSTSAGAYRPLDDAKVGIRIFATSPAAVPEPISWAMMVAGLGIVGGVLRGQRRKAATARLA